MSSNGGNDELLLSKFLQVAEDYLRVRGDEFPYRRRIWVQATDSVSIRLAIVGVGATFFTWGVAYIFEYIASREPVYLIACIFFIGGSGLLGILAPLQYRYYHRVLSVIRHRIVRVIDAIGMMGS